MSDGTTLKDQAARDAAAKVADYEHGWSSDIETDFAPKGLNEDTVRFISAKKNEPEWMLEWRLKAFAMWKTMTPPDWAKLNGMCPGCGPDCMATTTRAEGSKAGSAKADAAACHAS